MRNTYRAADTNANNKNIEHLWHGYGSAMDGMLGMPWRWVEAAVFMAYKHNFAESTTKVTKTKEKKNNNNKQNRKINGKIINPLNFIAPRFEWITSAKRHPKIVTKENFFEIVIENLCWLFIATSCAVSDSDTDNYRNLLYDKPRKCERKTCMCRCVCVLFFTATTTV